MTTTALYNIHYIKCVSGKPHVIIQSGSGFPGAVVGMSINYITRDLVRNLERKQTRILTGGYRTNYCRIAVSEKRSKSMNNQVMICMIDLADTLPDPTLLIYLGLGPALRVH